MRFKKLVPVRIDEQVVSAGVTCDGCGKPIVKIGFDQTEVTIGAKIGDYYPEGDSREIYDLDICGECFVEKVVPALSTVGLVFRERASYDDDRVWAKA